MQVIHFLADVEPGPLCGRPEVPGWLWSASPQRVTCAGCALLLANAKSRERPLPRSTPPPQAGPLTAIVRVFTGLSPPRPRTGRHGRTHE